MNRATDGLPDEARGAWELLLEFDARRGRLRQSLREALRSAIQDGRLAAGTVLPASALDYGDHRGRLELRTALSAYLARVRGVRIDPGHMVITQGFTQALDLLCHVLASSGRSTVALESPSHPGLWATVRQAGLTLAGCPVDEHGLRTARLPALGADAVVVSPAHEFPTGAVMAPARRAALIEWAARTRG